MKEKILALLRTSSDYISGQAICEKLGVSRTAVWKNINALKAEGYIIDAVNNKGYRLVGEPDIVTKEKIEAALTTSVIGRELYYYDETDSTNIRAKLAGETDGTHGALFVANEQNAGRGRRGRAWSTPKGTSIAMTFLLRPDVPIENVSRLTILSALATARALADTAGLQAQIKWPNDVVVSRKKICGILTEMGLENGKIREVIIGDGVNVNLEEFPDELKDKATSLYLETGKKYDRNRLIGLIMEKFERNYEKFTETCDLSPLIDDYNVMLANRNQPVRILDKINPYEGIAIGIDREGELLVKVADGEIRKVCSGEVSVRGLYSYV